MAGSKGQDDESDEDDRQPLHARLRTTTKGKDGPGKQRPWSSVTSTKKNTGRHGEEKSDRQISVILSDTDVLDCPICFEPLRLQVFQCKNGHIACASCCTKMANKCSNCSLQIGFVRCRAIEKVVESVTISCPNAYYGCKETMLYSKKLDHENACIYVPCSCPHPACDYVGLPPVLYTHFVGNHSDYSMLFDFDSPIPISSLDKSHNQIFLLERNECIIFVLNNTTNSLGSLVNVVRMGRASEKRRSSYRLISRDGESTIKLDSVADNMPRWSPCGLVKKFLLVPNEFIGSSGRFKLEVIIRRPRVLV
ncbi:E3 ubiquitin-protein ligase [Forsythia ovata]|uniref:RING-type E3 ubiquitin transferase n=1 Tax=Forsythia ovata TaxID=205694 RepID=A0ABD1UBR3_9LAMI